MAKSSRVASMESGDMLKHQLARHSIASILLVLAAAASANDFSTYTDESALFKVVRAIPASDKSANAAGYARLLELNPDNPVYWAKFERYSGGNEAQLLRVVRGIPAANKSANAFGYARLMALNPNNELYRAKFERYSAPSKRPDRVTSTSDLGAFLAGSWCVLDTDSGYVSGPYVEKLVVMKDGHYALFSKQAASVKWDGTRDKGRFLFREGRYPDTGEKYFTATPEVYGAVELVVDATEFTVSWKRGDKIVGETGRDSCGRFE